MAALDQRSGVRLVRETSDADARSLISEIRRHRRPGDIVLVSIHWGGNWGHEILQSQRTFAHRLVESQAVDVVHGHSSHHVKAFEVHAGKLVLYGCGDFLTDYEGIEGYDSFRGELALMYFPLLDPATGNLLELRLVPMRTIHFRSHRATELDRRWLHRTLAAQCTPFGIEIAWAPRGPFFARWS